MKIRQLLLLMMICFRVGATEQQPDLISINGKTFNCNRYLYLLEEYFLRHPERKPQTHIHSTGLRRGYIATFEFKDWEMCLKSISIDTAINEQSVDKTDYALGPLKKLKIAWFSGVVILPSGTIYKTVDCKYYDCNLYTEYTVFKVVNGDVTKQRSLTYNQYKQCVNRHYEAYTLTSDYEKDYDYRLANGYFESEDFLERFERWDKAKEGRKVIIDETDPLRNKYLRKLHFRKTSEYRKGYELWSKQPKAIFNAEAETRTRFEFSILEPVLQDAAIMQYYID